MPLHIYHLDAPTFSVDVNDCISCNEHFFITILSLLSPWILPPPSSQQQHRQYPHHTPQDMAERNIKCYVVGPAKQTPHLHTIIMLHGKGSSGIRFARDFLAQDITPPCSTRPLKLHERFDCIRWVFPYGSFRDPPAGRDAWRWFYMSSLSVPHASASLQQPDLRVSVDRVLLLIAREARRVPRGNIFLCGLDQGMAVAVATLLVDGRGEFSGVIGLAGWVPFAERIMGEGGGGEESGEERRGMALVNRARGLYHPVKLGHLVEAPIHTEGQQTAPDTPPPSGSRTDFGG